MRTRQTTALALAMSLAAGLIVQPLVLAQGAGSIAGTAKKEAKSPFTTYSVRARNVAQGIIAASTPLDPSGGFSLSGIDPANYLVELLDPKGKVVCTEGPFDLTKQSAKAGVNIDCGKKTAAWLLLAAAGAAGVTAGVITNDPASPSR